MHIFWIKIIIVFNHEHVLHALMLATPHVTPTCIMNPSSTLFPQLQCTTSPLPARRWVWAVPPATPSSSSSPSSSVVSPNVSSLSVSIKSKFDPWLDLRSGRSLPRLRYNSLFSTLTISERSWFFLFWYTRSPFSSGGTWSLGGHGSSWRSPLGVLTSLVFVLEPLRGVAVWEWGCGVISLVPIVDRGSGEAREWAGLVLVLGVVFGFTCTSWDEGESFLGVSVFLAGVCFSDFPPFLIVAEIIIHALLRHVLHWCTVH